jgi:4-hydroxy-4-methyl-2-oxoglutarate aldolase
MIEDPPLLKVKKTRRRPTSAQIKAFENIPTGQIVDARGGRGALSLHIQQQTKFPEMGQVIAGPAMTAENASADVLASFAAIHYAQKGDVLVAGFAGNQSCAGAGDRLCGMLQNTGGVALVMDCPVRDVWGIDQLNFPVWATGTTPATPFMTGPGRVGYPIEMGGQQICDGDMVIADSDGVVIVPFEDIERVLAALKQVQKLEAELDRKVADGLVTHGKIAALLASGDIELSDD